MPSWILKSKEGITVKVHIVPNSSKTQIIGEHGDRLKIKIKSPPVDGKANEEILEFLCEKLGIKKHLAEIARGHSSKSKDIFISATSIDTGKITT